MRDLRILIVDDFEAFRRFVSSTLRQRAEFRIVGEASDGWEAVQRANELQPDVILLDVGLPNLNGLEVARKVRALSPAKLLFISAFSDPDVVREAFRLGALAFVHKPHAQSELILAIDAVLGGKRFVGKAAPNEVLEWTATAGDYEITALDDHGRVGSCSVVVR